MHFSMSQATHLLMVDRDRSVVMYNQINSELIRVSKDREHYLELRGENVEVNEYDFYKKWNDRLNLLSIPLRKLPHIKSLLSRETKYFWYHAVVSRFNLIHFTSDPNTSIAKDPPFADANYLYYPKLFNKLQMTAQQDSLQVLQLDLSDSNKVHDLIQRIKKSKIDLSVIDVSNAWWNEHIGTKQFFEAIAILQEIAKPDTKIILTDNPNSPYLRDWTYHSFNLLGFNKAKLAKTIGREQASYHSIYEPEPVPELSFCSKVLQFFKN